MEPIPPKIVSFNFLILELYDMRVAFRQGDFLFSSEVVNTCSI